MTCDEDVRRLSNCVTSNLTFTAFQDIDILMGRGEEVEPGDRGHAEPEDVVDAPVAGVEGRKGPKLAATTSCVACASWRRKASRAKRGEKPWSECLTRQTKAGRVKKTTAMVQDRGEARAIIARFHRNFPELELMAHGVVTNLDLLTLIRDCRLSYNTVISFPSPPPLSLPSVSPLSPLLPLPHFNHD